MPNPTISRRNDTGGELSAEINAFVQELYGMGLGWTITSTKRGDPGSRHHSFDAMDVGVSGSDDASMLQFFFGENFDPSSDFGKLTMTQKGLEFCKKHNIRILDERKGSGGAHFHFETITEDNADIVAESENEATYHNDGRLINITHNKKTYQAYEYGLEVKSGKHTYVKNSYNKSEEYQSTVKDGENVDLKKMTSGGGSTGDVDWVNTNETILNYESTEDKIVSEEPITEVVPEEEVVVEEEVVPEEEVVVSEETALPKLEYKAQIGIWEDGGIPREKQELINRLREEEGYTVVKTHDKGILYKYSVYKTEDGPLTTKAESDKLTKELKNLGFEDAFIYAEKTENDGWGPTRIRMEDAAKLESSIRVEDISNAGGVNYRVKVGVFEENVNEKTQALFDKIEESGEYVIKKELDKGILYNYIAERKDGANTLEDAESIKKAMNDAGIKDAFIYAEDKSGNRINMEEAVEAQKKYNEKKKEEEEAVEVEVDEVDEEVVEEEKTTTTLTEEEQNILNNYSIDGTVGEGKAEIKDSTGKTIAYLEGNKLIGKQTIPIIGEKTFEIGEYVDNGDGTYTFKEGKDYNTVMSAASAEDKKVIETFRKAAEDNPQFAQDIINTTEGNDTNMSGDDLKTSATTFTSSSEVEELDEEELLDQEWREEEIEELEKNKEYIDEIFAENPEIAAKYEGVPIEKYSEIDGYYEEVYEPMYEKKEVALENQRQVNKEETGVFETNQERETREKDTARFNELEERKNNNTITSEEQTELTEIISNYGGNNPNERYEINKTEQEERDANIEDDKGDVTNVELEQQEYQQEIKEEDLEAEREENFRLYGKRETDEQKYTRIEKEKDENEEKGLGRLTNVQVEDENVIFSTPNSEKALRNELKKDLKKKEDSLKVVESEEKKSEIEEDIETTKLALEYLELKKEYGNKDDVFDIKTLKEAVENNDNQQISMFYNDQRGEVVNKLESQRQSIVDGTFEGTEKEKEKILSTLEELNTSTQKSELPEFDSEHDKLLYMTNATNEDIDKLKALEKDKKFIEEKGKVNTQILNVADGDVANSGLTDTDMSSNHDYIAVINPKDGSTQYVKKDWVNSFDDNDEEIERLEKKERKGTITLEEKVTLKKYTENRFHSRDVLEQRDINMETSGHPSGINSTYYGGTDEIDLFLDNRKKKIFQTGANPDINLTPEQIAKFDEINSENYDMSNLENDLDQIVSYSPESFEFDTELESVTDQEVRSQGLSGQEILQGTIQAAKGITDAFGGPDGLINAVMGKKALAAAMKDVTPMEQAKLSPMFQQHLRETKELSKRGYHPSEELKIRRGIDKAYQQGLENTIRGTAGDRAKYLAASGIFDAQRTSALLEVAAQDAVLQRENQKQYSELLTYKEDFDAKQQEAKRTENLQMQLANKKAASEFAGLTFANALSGAGRYNSLLDQIKNGLANTEGGFNLTSIYDKDNNTNLNEEQ